MLSDNSQYNELIQNIGQTIVRAKQNAIKSVNFELIKDNWEIGRFIVEFEQKGENKATYGDYILKNLSMDLKSQYGKGFSKSNIYLYRQFYINFPIFQTVSGKLTWSHIVELLSITNKESRAFYIQRCEDENWSVRILKRNIDTSLYERYVLSSDKEEFNPQIKHKNTEIWKQIIKDPYVFEFLDLPKDKIVKEKDLEKRLLDNIEVFLLELGKGFSFVARQFSINIDNTNYYVDLVFYHRILKCFVLIDLKTRKVKHQDIGQMNMYLNYFKYEENIDSDEDPIGIIITAEKNEFLVKYATGGLSNKIFVSKYQLYLPDKQELENQIRSIINS